jgi:tetratricopeptide (TPR) repeat protein
MSVTQAGRSIMAKRTIDSILLTVLGMFLFHPSAFAEADIRWQLEDLTKQIGKQPTNAQLYLSRGDLYRAQERWDAAQADFDFACALNPAIEQVDFLRGRMYLEANWPISAKLALDRFLSKQSNHVEALVLRARALSRLESRFAASQDYTRAIQLSTEPRPDLYLERAQALSAEGEAYFKEALRGLDEGIKKLGPLVTLQLGAIDLEGKYKHYDEALARVDSIAAASPRKETWLARRGELLQQAGRNDEARAAFQSALEAINTLPAGRKNVPAMVELQTRIEGQLKALP